MEVVGPELDFGTGPGPRILTGTLFRFSGICPRATILEYHHRAQHLVPEPHNRTPRAPEGNLALGNWVQPLGREKTSWRLSPRHMVRSAWTPSSTVAWQPKKPCQRRTLGNSPQRQRIERALFIGCRGNLRWAFYAPRWRALLFKFP